MTYVRQQTSEELAAHMRYLQGLPGWHDPLADRLWQEVEALRAENAGLKTGYEAYERVNAELKAEVELLRSLLGQSALAATTLRTDAEAYANHSGFNRGFVDFIRSISGVEVGHGYGSSKYPQQADVVAALGQGEQS